MKIFFTMPMIFIFLLSGCSPSAAIPTETAIPPTLTQALGIGSTQVSPNDGMTMVYVPAGDFLMGSVAGEGDDDEHPQHTVTLDAYWIDQTEVTNAMFTIFINDSGYQTDAEKAGQSYVFVGSQWDPVSGADWQHPQGPASNLAGLENHPVAHISWNDAVAYCGWAERSLPTEAQWEKAARGKDGQKYPWGNDLPAGNLVNFADINLNVDWAEKSINDGYQFTAPVGSYPDGKSPYHTLDMAGNVYEWVADWYGPYPSGSVSNPDGPSSGDYRVLRGGSWLYVTSLIRSAYRYRNSPADADDSSGFRCALSQ